MIWLSGKWASNAIIKAVRHMSSTVKKAENKKEIQTAHARESICNAAIWCLDQFGYAETTINRITERAAVSRGALTHHFPSKEDLIVESVERLLARMSVSSQETRRRHAQRGESVERALMWLWRQFDTMQGRALVEILIASRTDAALNKRISKELTQWDNKITEDLLTLYGSADGDDKDAALIWNICRAFLRGLIVHERFVQNDRELQKMASRFAEIMSPYLKAQ